MRFKRRRGSTVHWLPDQSDFATNIYFAEQAANVQSSTQLLDLLPNAGIDPDTAAGDTAARMTETGLIIKTITGKISWAMLPAPSPNVPAGIWGCTIRMGIIAIPQTINADPAAGTMAATSAQSALTAASYGMYEMNPTLANFRKLGSRTDARWWWRRDFQFLAMSQPVTVNSELMAPPGPYVQMHPNKLLRARYRLALACQFATIAVQSATGHMQVAFGHDLRVAAKPTYRRI